MKKPKPIKSVTEYVRRRRPNAINRVSREISSGGIVYRKNDKGKIEVLLIQDMKNRWSVPKGKPNKGETLREAAEREIREETGLQNMQVRNWLGKVSFRFRRKNALVLKTMHVYLVEAEGKSGSIKEEEVDWIVSAQWFPAMEALDKIEYEEIGNLMLIALEKLRKAGKR